MRLEVRTTSGGVAAPMVPISGMVIWKSDSSSSRKASNSSSARSISSIRSTAWSPARTASSRGRSSRNFGPKSLSTASSSLDLAFGQGADLQHLAGVVPLVEGLVGVDALVALQPDEAAAGHGRQGLGHLRLADADLALEQDRPAERQRDEERRRQATVGEVAAGAQQVGQLADAVRRRALAHCRADPEATGDQRGSAGPRTRSRTLPPDGAQLALAGQLSLQAVAQITARLCQPVEADVLHVPARLRRAEVLVELVTGLPRAAQIERSTSRHHRPVGHRVIPSVGCLGAGPAPVYVAPVQPAGDCGVLGLPPGGPCAPTAPPPPRPGSRRRSPAAVVAPMSRPAGPWMRSRSVIPR